MIRWIDGHLDLAYLTAQGRDLTRPCRDAATGCVSLPDLREGGVELCFGTIFLDVARGGRPGCLASEDVDAVEREALRQIVIYEELERQGHLRIVRDAADLPAITPPTADASPLSDDAPLRMVILMEGADPIRSPEHVPHWHERGVRLVGMTWAFGSRYAGGNAAPGPLTGAGRELVHALDDAGIIHDLSHLADEAMDEVLDLARGAVAASHSNARALMHVENQPPSQRHLRDESIRAIASRGGVIGLNLFSKFLANDRRATIDDAVAHVEHIAEVMGTRRGVALGSDADGGFPPTDLPIGLDHPRAWRALPAALAARGWSPDDLHGFQRGNWVRFLRRAWR